MGWGSFGDSRSYGGSNLGGSAQKRDRDYGGGQSERNRGSRRSDYSFSKVNEWHSSKQRSGGNDRGWSLTDNSAKSRSIRSAVAQQTSTQIPVGSQSIDPYSSTLQDVRNTNQRVTPTNFRPGTDPSVPVSSDALSDVTMQYTAQAKEEITKDFMNVLGPFGSVAQGLGLLEREPDTLSSRGRAAQGALKSVASEKVNERDNLTGSTLVDNVLVAAASFIGGPVAGIIARGAVAAGSAAKMTDSPYYDGEQVRHQGVADYGEGRSEKVNNPTKLTLQESLKSKPSPGSSVNVVPPARDTSIGIGTGSLSGRVADFAGSLAIKPKRNGRRGRV